MKYNKDIQAPYQKPLMATLGTGEPDLSLSPLRSLDWGLGIDTSRNTPFVGHSVAGALG